jgi:hypothetical protein
MSRIKFIHFLLPVFFCPAFAHATAETTGFWNAFFLQGQFKKGSSWGYFFESQVRVNPAESANRGNRILVRPAIRYIINSEWSLAAGYGWTPNLSPFLNESRLWEQVTFQKSIQSGSIQSRTRIEQRDIEGLNDISHRVRELVRWNYRKASSPIGLAVWDELFINLNTPGGSITSGFDQNRAFIGPALYFANTEGSTLRMEAGYMSLLQEELHTHVFAVNLFIDF